MVDEPVIQPNPQDPSVGSLINNNADTIDIEGLKQQFEEYKAGWQRAVADYQNLQREMARQRGEWAAMSEMQILTEFIPIYENFKKAFNNQDQEIGNWKLETETREMNWKKGIAYIMKQFGDTLKAHGVDEIKTVGEMFDPTKHEIVGEEEADQPTHTIVREVEGGYSLKGKIVKVAKVVVVNVK